MKQGGVSVVADAREALDALALALNDYRVDEEYASRIGDLARDWDAIVESVYNPAEPAADGSLNQNQVIGLVNTLSDPRDVVVCAAGSMPGDLHKLWRTRDSKGYHVEYGYSCMGYEVAGGLGVRMACPDRDVFVMVGDGSYLMMATELVTAVQERLKVIVVLVQNHGFAPSVHCPSRWVPSASARSTATARMTDVSTEGFSRSIWPRTPPASVSTSSAPTPLQSSPTRSRLPKQATPAPSSTSKPIR